MKLTRRKFLLALAAVPLVGRLVPRALVSPGHITQETAARLKKMWDQNFSGAGPRTAILSDDGLVYEFHVPVPIGPDSASYSNIEALNRDYYSALRL